nr:MAG TPA: hypothetical protein [Caudoviricetes sp.]
MLSYIIFYYYIWASFAMLQMTNFFNYEKIN